MSADGISGRERLRRVIESHRVVYERQAAKVVQDGQLRVVGFDVLLIGTYNARVMHEAMAICQHCAEVWNDLKEIAVAVAPPESERTRFTIAAFSPRVHYAKERGERPDIELIAELRHWSHYNDPVDSYEEECVKHVVERLNALGVPERRW